MKDERRKQTEAIFRRVVSMTPSEQAECLDAQCHDLAMQAAVERMLEYENERGELLTRGIPAPDAAPPIEPDQAMHALWSEADRIWDRGQDRREFRGYVSADYEEVYQALVRLRGRLATVLEWGSGLGVVTIMASRLGFEAYGIESESRLVDWSRELARRYGPGARFVSGSFIPREYEWSRDDGAESFRSDVEAEPGYDELDMELRDFDLVYVFPWPDELLLCRNIMRECGGENSLFLSYDVREGIMLGRFGHRR